MAELIAADRAFSLSVIDTVHETLITEPVPALRDNRVFFAFVAYTTDGHFLRYVIFTLSRWSSILAVR